MEDKKEFIEREWNEEIEGHLDDDGFFITPNGSFWDPDYVYFNREGLDKHGGKYDEKGEYIPGPGWDEEYNCYESEKEDEDLKDDEDDCEGDINITEQDMMNELACFDDDDDLLEGKNLTNLDPNIEIIVQKETDYVPEEEYEPEEKGNDVEDNNNEQENNENNIQENNENNNNNIQENNENNNENKNESNNENNEVEEPKKESNEKNNEGKKERVFNITTKDNEKIVITGGEEDDKEGGNKLNNNYNNYNKGKKYNNNYYKNNNYHDNNNYYKNKNNNYGNNKNYNNKGPKKYQQFNNFDELKEK